MGLFALIRCCVAEWYGSRPLFACEKKFNPHSLVYTLAIVIISVFQDLSRPLYYSQSWLIRCACCGASGVADTPPAKFTTRKLTGGRCTEYRGRSCLGHSSLQPSVTVWYVTAHSTTKQSRSRSTKNSPGSSLTGNKIRRSIKISMTLIRKRCNMYWLTCIHMQFVPICKYMACKYTFANNNTN